ncbi:hypothetical protein T484DRAFT_1880407 [Baffinella frigidus]|nr:hypothetical protein T484DRAFT_1880407 [Cryptophyta sp. CCMP2293]
MAEAARFAERLGDAFLAELEAEKASQRSSSRKKNKPKAPPPDVGSSKNLKDLKEAPEATEAPEGVDLSIDRSVEDPWPRGGSRGTEQAAGAACGGGSQNVELWVEFEAGNASQPAISKKKNKNKKKGALAPPPHQDIQDLDPSGGAPPSFAAGGGAEQKRGGVVGKHGFSAEQVPVSACVGSSKSLQDLKGDECVICLEDARTHVVLPCGHWALCGGCAGLVGVTLFSCPVQLPTHTADFEGILDNP